MHWKCLLQCQTFIRYLSMFFFSFVFPWGKARTKWNKTMSIYPMTYGVKDSLIKTKKNTNKNIKYRKKFLLSSGT